MTSSKKEGDFELLGIVLFKKKNRFKEYVEPDEEDVERHMTSAEAVDSSCYPHADRFYTRTKIERMLSLAQTSQAINIWLRK